MLFASIYQEVVGTLFIGGLIVWFVFKQQIAQAAQSPLGKAVKDRAKARLWEHLKKRL